MTGVPDLDATLWAQRDVEALCADRALDTSEIFQPNAYYGADAILKRYTGRAAHHAIKAVIPHGPSHDCLHLWRTEIEAMVPAAFSFSPNRDELYRRLTSKVVVPTASPYLYMLVQASMDAGRRDGTIYFPSHSTHHVTSTAQFEQLAASLVHIDDECRPVTVCMYWRDIELGNHRPFLDLGLPIVSAGHMYDPDFLYRFHHLCSQHRYAAGNSVGSHLHYAVKSGCAYFLFDGNLGGAGDEDPYGPTTEANTESVRVHVPRPPRIAPLFRERVIATTAAQMAVVDYYLGTARQRTARDLEEQLDDMERLDRLGYRPRRAGAPWLVGSPLAKRTVRRSVNRVRRAAKVLDVRALGERR